MPTDTWRRANNDKLKAYRRAWYAKNKKHAKTKTKDRVKSLRIWLSELKSKLSCECGEDHVACLEFHHLDSAEKELEISQAPSYGWSKKRILKEIEKCKVLCANCHRKLHHTSVV